MTLGRAIALLALLVASTWVALFNGQPLFHPDTSAYVRGPDFAVVYLFGNNFATSWTQERTLEGKKGNHTITKKQKAPEVRLNSPFDNSVLNGRSIYYGALLYFAHITSA